MPSVTASAAETAVTTTVRDMITKYTGLLNQVPVAPSVPSVTSSSDPPTPQPKLPKSKDSKFTRPNGEVYLARKLSLGAKTDETTDIDFVRTGYAHGMTILLYGPPGTGKTSMFEAALPGLLSMTGTGQTEAGDFVGDWVQLPDGTYKWKDGPLIQAAEEGRPLLVNEIALIDPRELAIVYSLMDGSDELEVTANPAREVVKAKPGFLVLGATNPDVPGAVMSPALLSRFKIHVEVGTDWLLAKQLGVGSKIITVAKNLGVKRANSEVVAAPQLREVLTFRDVAKVYGEQVAIANFVSQARVEDRDIYAKALAATFGIHGVGPLTFGGAS